MIPCRRHADRVVEAAGDRRGGEESWRVGDEEKRLVQIAASPSTQLPLVAAPLLGRGSFRSRVVPPLPVPDLVVAGVLIGAARSGTGTGTGRACSVSEL